MGDCAPPLKRRRLERLTSSLASLSDYDPHEGSQLSEDGLLLSLPKPAADEPPLSNEPTASHTPRWSGSEPNLPTGYHSDSSPSGSPYLVPIFFNSSQASIEGRHVHPSQSNSALLGQRAHSGTEDTLPLEQEPGEKPLPTLDLDAILAKDVNSAPTGYVEYVYQEPAVDLSTLDKEQLHALEIIRQGKNVFITGPAGTGKSYLLKAIVQDLRKRGFDKPGDIVKTALTGTAAQNIDGRTIHSFSGVGYAKRNKKALIDQTCANRGAQMRWTNAQVLIIDEISMMQGRIFTILEELARKITQRHQRFGGIQLIILGDFYQLAPVPDKTLGDPQAVQFAFESKAWKPCVDEIIELTQVHRQSDRLFAAMLNAIRLGLVTAETIKIINGLSRPLNVDPESVVHLYPKRSEAEMHNRTMLDRIISDEHVFHAADSYVELVDDVILTPEHARRILEGVSAPAVLPLRIGARVMLLRNMPSCALVNGSCGTVHSFSTIAEAMEEDEVELTLTPKTIKASDDAPQKRDPGTDRKRRTIEAIKQLHAQIKCVAVDIPKSAVVGKLMRGSGRIALDDHTFDIHQRFPLVVFDNKMKMLCVPLIFREEGRTGHLEVERLQIPISMAWAITIHKSQGKTLPYVKTDLCNVFAPGHIYVALSRAPCMENLQVLNFNSHKTEPSLEVLCWDAERDPTLIERVQTFTTTTQRCQRTSCLNGKNVHRVLVSDVGANYDTASQIMDKYRQRSGVRQPISAHPPQPAREEVPAPTPSLSEVLLPIVGGEFDLDEYDDPSYDSAIREVRLDDFDHPMSKLSTLLPNPSHVEEIIAPAFGHSEFVLERPEDERLALWVTTTGSLTPSSTWATDTTHGEPPESSLSVRSDDDVPVTSLSFSAAACDSVPTDDYEDLEAEAAIRDMDESTWIL